MTAKRRLTAIIEREDIASQGDSVEEARANLIEALKLFFEDADRSEVARRLDGGWAQ